MKIVPCVMRVFWSARTTPLPRVNLFVPSDVFKCTECVGEHDEPQCQLVCEPDCIVPNPDFPETPEELQAKYDQLHS